MVDVGGASDELRPQESESNVPHCRHCRRRVTSIMKPKGLCCTCYPKLWVREQYQTMSVYGSRGYGGEIELKGEGVEVKLARDPTGYAPGTEGKIEVMRERAYREECLFHPLDATLGKDQHSPCPAIYYEQILSLLIRRFDHASS